MLAIRFQNLNGFSMNLDIRASFAIVHRAFNYRSEDRFFLLIDTERFNFDHKSLSNLVYFFLLLLFSI